MGIRGFDSFLRQRYGGDEIRFDAVVAGNDSAAAPPPPPPSRHLIVDANGLAHFLFAERGVDFWCGGDFSALEAAVAWFVAPFRRNGVRLLCVFDGGREQGKAATQRERRESKADVFSRIMHQLEVRIFILSSVLSLVTC
jgi:hypothetical protein